MQLGAGCLFPKAPAAFTLEECLIALAINNHPFACWQRPPFPAPTPPTTTVTRTATPTASVKLKQFEGVHFMLKLGKQCKGYKELGFGLFLSSRQSLICVQVIEGLLD